MPETTPANAGQVIPEYRGEGDPRYPVPAAIWCPDCAGQALLTPYIVGYGYDCGKCGAQIPIAA